MSNANYIKVDRIGDGTVIVCDMEFTLERQFADDETGRHFAEQFAAREAKRIGCDWGCNY